MDGGDEAPRLRHDHIRVVVQRRHVVAAVQGGEANVADVPLDDLCAEVVDDVVSDHAEAPKSAEEKAAEASAPQKVKHRVFHYPGGLVDFVKHINRTKTAIQPSVMLITGGLRKGPGVGRPIRRAAAPTSPATAPEAPIISVVLPGLTRP